MRRRDERIERIRQVDRECQTAVVAIMGLVDALRLNPSFLQSHSLRQADLQRLRTHLEPTFLIRLFAEFEAWLRDAWRNAFGRRTHPPMRDLLESVAGRQSIPGTWLREAHDVRSYRNALVHEDANTGGTGMIPLLDVNHRLVRFFSRLPPDW